MILALTREVPSAINDCELTHLNRNPIDVDAARAQHAAYEAALEAAGCTVRRLPPLDDMPDSVFVEDTAVVVDELAVMTRPGAESRRGETASVAAALRAHRRVVAIEEPGTLDGGDVLQLGKTIYVGVSARTNAEGARQLRELLEPYGYVVKAVDVTGCLHLKSAVTKVASDTVLVNPDWIDKTLFQKVIEVDPAEPFAANALLVGDTLLCGAAYPRTNARLKNAKTVDASELAKAEGGLTCCSILLTV
ncbi:MAG TPA: arginine deiminase family protein [Thermoanaerobaculia bacterium]|nr:arginine deiminase family protein [Thermoanaerobaculia bacterium]